MKTASEIIIESRARAFSGEGVRSHRFLVSEDEVRVWDAVAFHYTTCHALCQSAIKRLKQEAWDRQIELDVAALGEDEFERRLRA